MARLRIFFAHVFEWLGHIHTSFWILEALGLGALVSVAFATVQRLLHSNVDWLLIVVGFGVSSVMIYLSLALPIRDRRTVGLGTQSGASDQEALVRFFSSIEPASPESTLQIDSPVPTSGAPDVSSPNMAALFTGLGIVRSLNGRSQCVSESAEAFLASLQAHFLDGNARYFGDWSAMKTDERHRLAEMLTQWEGYRIRTAPNGDPRPSRRTKAALALIRADLVGEPRFIMISSPTWERSGPWWFPGGAQRSQDSGDLRNTVVREACEELALDPDNIRQPHSRGRCSERRLSKRVGLFTDYNYEIFAVQLKQLLPALRVVEGRIQTEERLEHFKWLPWNEILNSPFLSADASCIIDLLRQIDPRSIPSSGDLPLI
jgi:8-oxo-dGTP pyrophosphatase MutT (NUDIX family)